jgi:hypothetical protein
MSDQAGSLVTRATLGKTKTQDAVPVGASLPTDSRAASFLMTLPSEMRNLIYEALYVSNGRLECTKGSIGHEGRRWYEETSPSLRGSTALSRSEIALATPFLRSCRQVYHEAVGFLYSHNEFTLRPNTPMPAFDTWSRELGSQIILVRKVFVSVYALRGTVHVAGHYPNRVEILPILRLLWATGSSKLDIAITMDVTATSNPYFHHWEGAYLNRVPLLLGPEDSMDIPKYDRFRLLTSVQVHPDGGSGSVRFAGSDGESKSRYWYSISHDGSSTIAAWDETPPLSLERLPPEVYSQILDNVGHSLGAVRVKLPNEAVPLKMAVLCTARRMRRKALQSIVRTNEFVFEVELPAICNSHPDIKVIEEWYYLPYSRLRPLVREYFKFFPYIGLNLRTLF